MKAQAAKMLVSKIILGEAIWSPSSYDRREKY